MEGFELPANVSAASSTENNKILCCECGVLTERNALNTCLQCIQAKVDITEELSKQCLLQFCNKCERYLQPPSSWTSAALESRKLLGICLKRIKGLNKVQLVDAGFVWTEPHSKRIKVKLTVQKEVSGGAALQQSCVVEFQVVNQICEGCQRVEAKDYWKCVVQVRQRAQHKKTFFYLEQLILKLNAHQKTVSIKQTHDGIDFFYAGQPEARKMVEFLMSAAPCRYDTAKRLISHDIHSNTYNYKYTYSVEIAPICKDDIVCLPQKLSKELGSIGPLCICYRVTQCIHLIDPKTLKIVEIDANTYFRSPFKAICSPKQLREFTIMDIDKVDDKPYVFGKESNKHELSDAWVVKSSEMSSNGQQHHTKTHLGRLLNIGDSALGFDLANANINDDNYDAIKPEDLPDVILVKKLYGDKLKRHKKRAWRLNRLPIDKDTSSVATVEDKDYLDFLEDLEEDPAARENVNIIKDKRKKDKANEETEDDEANDDLPKISLDEMIDELKLIEKEQQTADS